MDIFIIFDLVYIVQLKIIINFSRNGICLTLSSCCDRGFKHIVLLGVKIKQPNGLKTSSCDD